MFSNIVKVISKNKDTIFNFESATSSVVDTVGKIGSNAIDVVRIIKELWNKLAITDDAMNKVLTPTDTDTPKTENGFFYV